MSKIQVNPRKVALAFATVYILWGSTYLAIKFAIETIPPMIMIASRFLIAGFAMYAGLILTGAKHPRLKHWLSATVIGILLLGCGTGSVVLAEKSVPTGMVSLLVAMVPIYIALFEHFGKSYPDKRKLLGLAIGLVGVITLIGPGNLIGHGTGTLIGTVTVMAGSFCWSFGSIISRKAPKPESMLLSTAMQMICGGIALALVALITGEHTHFSLQAVTLKSWLAFLYLIVFGSIFGFTAYLWLLEHVSPGKVSTYAYVNPIVAVFLGCAFAGESISAQTAIAAAIILSAVWLITGEKSTAQSGAKALAEPLSSAPPNIPGPLPLPSQSQPAANTLADRILHVQASVTQKTNTSAR